MASASLLRSTVRSLGSVARTGIELLLAIAALVAAPFLIAQLYSAATDGPIAKAAAPAKSPHLVRSAYRVALTDWVLLSQHGETTELVNAINGDIAASWQLPETLITSVSATRDGQQLLATIDGGKLIYCDRSSGPNSPWLAIPDRQLVSQAILAPKGDRAFLLLQTAEGEVVESVAVGDDWELNQQTTEFTRSPGTRRIALSPCGEWLLGHDRDGNWFIWDADTGAIAQCGMYPALGNGLSLEWWPDSQGFVAGDCYGCVRSFCRRTDSVLWQTNCGPSAVGKLAVTNGPADVFKVVLATIAGETLVIDSSSGQVITRLRVSDGPIRLIHVGEAADILVTIDASGTIRRWEILTGRAMPERV